jgi:hypothetical protein
MAATGFMLSYRDGEVRLAERGSTSRTRPPVFWVLKFGPVVARRL